MTASAQPLPRSFAFGGSGSGDGYTAIVQGTGTIDPAAKTVSIAGTVTVTSPDATLVEQSFGHTATWQGKSTGEISFTLNPVEGLTMELTVVPGEGATIVITGP